MSKKTIAKLIYTQVDKQGNRPALYYKKEHQWNSISWLEMGRMIQAISDQLINWGIQVGDHIGIYSENRPEWTVSDYAILSSRAVTVPIYATNTLDEVDFILRDANIKVCFVAGKTQYDNLRQLLHSNHSLEKIVVFDPKLIQSTPEEEVHDFHRLAHRREIDGSRFLRILEMGESSDICSVIYTSGTTGEPKGVVLTNHNFCSQFEALDHYFDLNENDIELCFLPLSHAYGRCSSFWVHSHGASTYYCEDPKKVVDDLQDVRPTFMVGVPRFYEKVFAAIHKKTATAPFIKQKLFAWSIEVGKTYHYLKAEDQKISWLMQGKHKFADRMVLSKIRSLLGGRIKFFSAGGAALSKEIEEFFFACGVFISQGYGLTETSPIISFNHLSRFKFGSTGQVIDGSSVKIAEDGEILVKGPNVMQGYFNRPTANHEAFTDDGWFRTGDIGYLDQDHFLYITDRKKDLIVTAGGKNVAPQKIEKTLGEDLYIEQIVCFGDHRKYITALIVPAFESVKELFTEKGIQFSSSEDMVKDPRVIEFIQSRIDRYTSKFADYERVKRFKLMPVEFSLQSGEITPTLKAKRKVIQAKYGDLIDMMYPPADSQGRTKASMRVVNH